MRNIDAQFIEASIGKQNNIKFKNSKEVRDFLIKLTKSKSTPKSELSVHYTQNLSSVVNQLLSYSVNNDKIEEKKKYIDKNNK